MIDATTKNTIEKNPLVESVFNKKSDFLLPSIIDYKEHIVFDTAGYDDFDWDKNQKTMRTRDLYNKYSFCILNDDFFKKLKQIINDLDIKSCAELSCGTGFFTYWARKYGINVQDCVDNYSWEKTFKNNVLLDLVTNCDSVKYVLEHPEINLFILSWPYMDEVATTIWAAMKKGQYLLYIGEDIGGCTANDDFFRITNKYIIEDKSKELAANFISFFGIHDRPSLYLK